VGVHVEFHYLERLYCKWSAIHVASAVFVDLRLTGAPAVRSAGCGLDGLPDRRAPLRLPQRESFRASNSRNLVALRRTPGSLSPGPRRAKLSWPRSGNVAAPVAQRPPALPVAEHADPTHSGGEVPLRTIFVSRFPIPDFLEFIGHSDVGGEQRAARVGLDLVKRQARNDVPPFGDAKARIRADGPPPDRLLRISE